MLSLAPTSTDLFEWTRYLRAAVPRKNLTTENRSAHNWVTTETLADSPPIFEVGRKVRCSSSCLLQITSLEEYFERHPSVLVATNVMSTRKYCLNMGMFDVKIKNPAEPCIGTIHSVAFVILDFRRETRRSTMPWLLQSGSIFLRNVGISTCDSIDFSTSKACKQNVNLVPFVLCDVRKAAIRCNYDATLRRMRCNVPTEKLCYVLPLNHQKKVQAVVSLFRWSFKPGIRILWAAFELDGRAISLFSR